MTNGLLCTQKLFAENRNKKMELLSGLTIGQDDAVNISPLQQVRNLWSSAHTATWLPQAELYQTLTQLLIPVFLWIAMKDVLLVWGDKDQIFPLEMAKDLQGYVLFIIYCLFSFISIHFFFKFYVPNLSLTH
jgi:hypothetical protein